MTFPIDKQQCNCELTKWPEHVCPYKEYIWHATFYCNCCPYCESECDGYRDSLSKEDKERLK